MPLEIEYRGELQIVAFRNDRKTDKQPDYDILLSESKEQEKQQKTL
jgi:hypothetical protein